MHSHRDVGNRIPTQRSAEPLLRVNWAADSCSILPAVIAFTSARFRDIATLTV